MRACLLITVLALSTAVRGADEARLLKRISDAGKKAANALIDSQNPDGGYGPRMDGRSDIGVTALAVWALALSPSRYREWDGPFISAAVDYLLAHQKEDGGVHDGTLWNYNTSIAIMALTAVNAEKYAPQIAKAAAFVKGLQLTENSPAPYDPARHVSAYGWGYGSTRRADLSNTNIALEALATAGVSKDDPLWVRSRLFLSRCQNSCTTNDAIFDGLIPQWGTNDDGGFMYTPGASQLPPTRLQDGTNHYSSYGSMTYAGIKSFIYAQMDREDERIQNAYRWICRNWSVDMNVGLATDRNPELGAQGLFYYYRTLAKALLLWDEPEIPTPQGPRRWAVELGEKLVSLQRPDGTWVNTADRWWEGMPAISTSYAILALNDVAEAITKWPAPSQPPQ